MVGVFGRAIFLYLLLIFAIRLMGKRQLGQMEPAEFVVTMLLANLAGTPVSGGSLLSAVIPILGILGVQLILAGASLQYIPLRNLLCGKPVLLISEGEIQQENLRKTRFHLDELFQNLRKEGILDLSAVQYAVLETNGQVSVLRYPDAEPPTAQDLRMAVEKNTMPLLLVSDGQILRQNLRHCGRDLAWLETALKHYAATPAETFLLTLTGERLDFIRKEACP